MGSVAGASVLLLVLELGGGHDALAVGRPLLAGNVLLAQALAALAIGLGLRGGAGIRPRRVLRGGRCCRVVGGGGMAARLRVIAARGAGRRVAGGEAGTDEQRRDGGGGG